MVTSSPWQEAKSPDGRFYYYNALTKATQWTKPHEMMTPAELALQDLDWKEHKAQDGRKYWYHVKTRETTWNMPSEYQQALEKTLEPSHGIANAPAFVAGGTINTNTERSLAIPSQMNESAPDGTARPMLMARAIAQDDRLDEPHYSTIDEAEAAFIKLLRRTGVQADWTWERTMRATIKEPQYRALKDPKDRRSAFEKFVVELKQQEQERAKERIAKLRNDFSVMLKRHPEIKYYTRWKTARPIIEGETIFRSTSNEDERRQLFNEYILSLRKEEQEHESRDRKSAADELLGLLKSLNLEPYTRWSEAQSVLQKNERYVSERKFQVLSKLDILNAFETHIKFLEKTFNDEKQKIKIMDQRVERKNREGFVDLLNELKNKGEIRAGTKWKQIYPLIKDDKRFANMLGQAGSTPLDLFWDVAEGLERDIRLKRNIVLDIMDERRFELTSSTTLDQFASLLASDGRTAPLPVDTVSDIYNFMREKAIRRSEDDRHQAERHQRRKIDALRSVVKHLEPAVEVGDTYEQVRSRIEKLEEFKALGSEEARKTAFDKHMRRLEEKKVEKEKDRERREARDKDRTARGGRESNDRKRPREDSDSYLKSSSSSRHHRGASRQPTKSPEPDAYEAERRRAAGQREKAYGHRGSRRESPSPRERRHDRERSADAESRTRSESIYDRERREREEERERQYRTRDGERDEYRPARRRRGLTPEPEEREAKVSNDYDSYRPDDREAGRERERRRVARSRTRSPRGLLSPRGEQVLTHAAWSQRYRRGTRSPPPRPRSPPSSRLMARGDSPLINYGDDPTAINYGDDPLSNVPVVEEEARKVEKKDENNDVEGKLDKMDVNPGEESEEGEIAE